MTLSSTEAMASKAAALASDEAPEIWHCWVFPSCDEATSFANVEPAQHEGEFGMSCMPNGDVIGYYFF
ncbi:hypothetical protein [Streptomyces lavendulae]|uniref:hypothetical protein n=1 Tax=Streptomyces lavendulae TaxID=1914 RepID=UPI0031EE014C